MPTCIQTVYHLNKMARATGLTRVPLWYDISAAGAHLLGQLWARRDGWCVAPTLSFQRSARRTATYVFCCRPLLRPSRRRLRWIFAPLVSEPDWKPRVPGGSLLLGGAVPHEANPRIPAHHAAPAGCPRELSMQLDPELPSSLIAYSAEDALASSGGFLDADLVTL